MNQGGSNRGNRLAVCDSPDRELEAGAINPVILSSTQVSSFQFQVSLFTSHTAAYITRDNALWQESTQTFYPDFDSNRAVTTAKSRRKLTNLGAFAAVSEAEDIRGNVTTSTQAVDPSTDTRISTTTVPTSIQPQVQIQRYGLLMESISTTAVTNRYAYDALNRRVAVTDGRDNTSTTTYNTLGQTAFSEDAATNRTSYVYDDYGRQIEVIDALNQSTYTAYDLRGNVIRQYGATYPVWYEYDEHGRMVAMATNRDTTLDPATVDSLDNPSLDVTRWVYDPATGLLVQKLYDDGKGPSYTYSPDGKLATRTWARGVVTEYGYDALGSLLSVNYSDATPDVTYTYDRIGRQLSAIAAGVSTNLFTYSTNTLELIAEVQNGVVINRSRDVFGRESGIALASDYDVGYGYDTFGRFAQVSNFQFQVSYSYLSGSSLVSGMTASTGHAWSRSYEPQRNLIAAVTNSFNGNLISAFDYVNDALGRRTARLDFQPAGVANTNVFGYNIRSEVATALMGTNTYGYVFDPIGNRIVSTNNADVTSYAANALNQYTAISNAVPVLPVHDDDGNMLTNGVWSYTWDGENRLIGVSSNNVLLATHAYDHQSRRIGKVAGGTTQSFVYDGWNLIQELQSSTIPPFHSSTNSYVWGLDLDGTMQGAGGVGGLLAVISPLHLREGQGEGGTVYLPCYDANGNITEYVSNDGSIAAHYEYSPFGETFVQSGDLADAFAFRFSSKIWERESKLCYYGYRFYSPELGRWLNRDPIMEMGGVNLLLFCFNDSIDMYDLIGRMANPVLIGIAKDVLAGVVEDVFKTTLTAWFNKKMTEGNIMFHLRYWCQQKNEDLDIDLPWADSLDGIGKSVVKEALSNIPETVVDSVLWGKLKSAKYMVRTRAYARVAYGVVGQEIAEDLQQKILSDVRGQIESLSADLLNDQLKSSKKFTIRYFNPKGEHSDCTLCYTLKLTQSLEILDKKFSFTQSTTKCFTFDQLQEELARTCGLCPCTKGESK